MLTRKRVLIKIGLVLAASACLVISYHKHKIIKKKYQNYIIQELDREVKLNKFNFERQFIKPIEENKTREELEKRQKQQEIERQKQEESQWIPVRCSFYTNDTLDCGKTDGISASGKQLSRGGNYCAAPKDVNFGTKLYIQELGTYEVQDRGDAIRWKDGVMCLDIFIPNVSQEYLNRLGVKYSKAKIIK